MLDLQKLFTVDFWFKINVYGLDRSDRLMFYAAGCFLAVAVVFKVAQVFSPTPADVKVRTRFFNLFLVSGLLGILWYGLRAQNVKMFGTHIFALIILIWWAVWLGVIVKDAILNYRSEKQQWEKSQVRQKYLPG